MKAGRQPMTSEPATISPHAAIGTGLVSTARTEVRIASSGPMFRSSTRGNETTLSANAKAANRKPTKLPRTIIFHPASVVNASRRKSPKVA